jgi:hypothetical protein
LFGMKTKIPGDRRVIHGRPDPEAVEALRAGRDDWLRREVALARLLERLDRQGAFVFEDHPSVVAMASVLGYDGHRARDLLDLGRAIAACPEVLARLEAKVIIFQAACCLGQILPFPEYLRPDDDWLEWARTCSLRDLRRAVRKRIAQVKTACEQVTLYVAHVDDEARQDLDRCQELASQRAKKLLTRGQTLGAVARHYLENLDPLEKTPGPRRMGPTAKRPFDRTVPAEVVVAIHKRAAGLCEVGGCMRPIEHLCHIEPHAQGSGREVRDLFGGCALHHKLYDARRLRFLEWNPDGRPVFYNRRMETVHPVPRDRREPPGASEPGSSAESVLARLLARHGHGPEAEAGASSADGAHGPNGRAATPTPSPTAAPERTPEHTPQGAAGAAPEPPAAPGTQGPPPRPPPRSPPRPPPRPEGGAEGASPCVSEGGAAGAYGRRSRAVPLGGASLLRERGPPRRRARQGCARGPAPP